jgi:hypothetical protein
MKETNGVLSMVRIASGLTAAALVVAVAAPALARTETVTGELVEQACYLKDKKNVGGSHKDCGETCARRGQPLAVVTAGGKIYQITGPLAADNNTKLIPHLAHTIEITGDVSEKDGRMMIAAGAGSLKMVRR